MDRRSFSARGSNTFQSHIRRVKKYAATGIQTGIEQVLQHFLLRINCDAAPSGQFLEIDRSLRLPPSRAEERAYVASALAADGMA